MPEEPKGTSRMAAQIIVTMTAFLTPFITAAGNIALPSIGREFGIDAILLSWVSLAYILSAAVFLLPFGRLADIRGQRKVFLFGLVGFTVFSALVPLSNSVTMLIILRVLQGIGGSVIYSCGTAILMSVFPPRERGKVIGINVTSVYIGLSLGPYLGGLLTERFGWRSIFIAVLPLGIAGIFLILFKLKGEWTHAKGEKFDLTGAVIYGFVLISLMYGISLLPSLSAVWFLLITAAALWLFIRWETRTTSPIFDIKMFRRNTVFALSSMAALISYSATVGIGFLLSLFLQYTRGFSPEQAGLVMIAQPIMQATVSPIAGRLSDRIEPRYLSSFGMSLTCLGLVIFACVSSTSSLWLIIAGLVTVGLGLACFTSPNTNAIMSSVEKKYYGVSSAIVSTMRLVGNILSIGIVMLMFALFIGRVQIAPENFPMFLQSMRVTFIIFAVMCFGGIFASLARGKVSHKTPELSPGSPQR